MATQNLSAQTAESNPLTYINHEGIHAKLMFLSSAVGAMDGERRVNFDDNAEYALALFLFEIAKEIFPKQRHDGEVRS